MIISVKHVRPIKNALKSPVISNKISFLLVMKYVAVQTRRILELKFVNLSVRDEILANRRFLKDFNRKRVTGKKVYINENLHGSVCSNSL